MKVMLRQNAAGKLLAYVAKKDLEEVVDQTTGDADRILTLANEWELAISNLEDPLQLPQTVEAIRT